MRLNLSEGFWAKGTSPTIPTPELLQTPFLSLQDIGYKYFALPPLALFMIRLKDTVIGEL